MIVSEVIDVNKISESKECDICHYRYLLNKSFALQPNICNRWHDLLMMYMNLRDIAILNINVLIIAVLLAELAKSRP